MKKIIVFLLLVSLRAAGYAQYVDFNRLTKIGNALVSNFVKDGKALSPVSINSITKANKDEYLFEPEVGYVLPALEIRSHQCSLKGSATNVYYDPDFHLICIPQYNIVYFSGKADLNGQIYGLSSGARLQLGRYESAITTRSKAIEDSVNVLYKKAFAMITEFINNQQFNDSYLLKQQCTESLLDKLKDDYEYDCNDGDCYAGWDFRTPAQDGPDVNKNGIISIVPMGYSWYQYTFYDMGNKGVNAVKIVWDDESESYRFDDVKQLRFYDGLEGYKEEILDSTEIKAKMKPKAETDPKKAIQDLNQRTVAQYSKLNWDIDFKGNEASKKLISTIVAAMNANYDEKTGKKIYPYDVFGEVTWPACSEYLATKGINKFSSLSDAIQKISKQKNDILAPIKYLTENSNNEISYYTSLAYYVQKAIETWCCKYVTESLSGNEPLSAAFRLEENAWRDMVEVLTDARDKCLWASGGSAAPVDLNGLEENLYELRVKSFLHYANAAENKGAEANKDLDAFQGQSLKPEQTDARIDSWYDPAFSALEAKSTLAKAKIAYRVFLQKRAKLMNLCPKNVRNALQKDNLSISKRLYDILSPEFF